MVDALAKANEQTQVVLALLQEWREPVLCIVLMAECIPVLGIIAPGLIILVLAGFVAGGADALEAVSLALTAFSAIFLTNLALFGVGKVGANSNSVVRRLIGDRGAFGQELAAQPNSILLLYQFPPYSRMFAPLLLGAAGLRWRRWLVLSAAATLAFVTVFFGMGFVAARLGRDTSGAATWAGGASAVSVLAFGAWIAVLLTRIFKRRARGVA